MTTGNDPLDGWGATPPPTPEPATDSRRQAAGYGSTGTYGTRTDGKETYGTDPSAGQDAHGLIARSTVRTPAEQAQAAGRRRVRLLMTYSFLSSAVLIAAMALWLFEPPLMWILLGWAGLTVVVAFYLPGAVQKNQTRRSSGTSPTDPNRPGTGPW